MTTTERIEVRKALLAAGFRRTNASHDRGDGVYTETWDCQKDGTKIYLRWDKKNRPPQTILTSAVFNGASPDQVRWGGNDDPTGKLTIGTLYDVVDIEVHSWHTKIQLQGVEGKFNSASFTFADPSVAERACEAWRRNR